MRLLRDTTPRRRLGALPAAGIGAASVLLLASGLRPVPRAGHPTPIAPQDAATPVQVAAPDSAEEALAGALRYLVENQQPDGRWRAVAGRDGGAAGEFDDVGVTGVALQALARGPKGLDVEGRVEAVQRGLAWLASRHDVERGAFKLPERSVHMLPSHAMATLGWSVAHARLGTLRDQATLDVLQGAVEFVSRARNPYRGWRYAYPPDGQSDAMATGWMLLVLRVADDLGLRYDEDGVRDGLTLFEDHYGERTGRVGYRMAGDPTPRFPSKKDSYPPDAVELPTAVAMTAKFAWDADPIEDPMMLKSAFLLLDHAPLWSRSRGTIDSYYWAFGTLAIRPYGGVFAQRWSAALIEAVTDHADETPTGSIHWAAVDAWHDEGGEVPMTAMCALALAAAIGD